MEKELLNSTLNALLFAANKHKFDKTKSDEPYINHLLKVCCLLCNVGGINDPAILIAAALHDILEKTTTKAEEIRKQFGDEVCNIVLELTEKQYLSDDGKLIRQLQTVNQLSPKAQIIKLADKIASSQAIILNPPNGWDIRKRMAYLESTEKIIELLHGTNEPLGNYFYNFLSEEKAVMEYSL